MTTHSDPLRLRASTIGKEGRLMAMWPEEVPAETPAAIEDLEARGIYELEYPVEGCRAFLAMTRRREVVSPGLRVMWPGESLSDVVAKLARDLRRADPIRPPYLRLAREEQPRTAYRGLTLREAVDLDGPAFARWLHH